MKAKYISARNSIILSLPDDLLGHYYEVYSKGCFRTIITDRLQQLDFIRQVLDKSR